MQHEGVSNRADISEFIARASDKFIPRVSAAVSVYPQHLLCRFVVDDEVPESGCLVYVNAPLACSEREKFRWLLQHLEAHTVAAHVHTSRQCPVSAQRVVGLACNSAVKLYLFQCHSFSVL